MRMPLTELILERDLPGRRAHVARAGASRGLTIVHTGNGKGKTTAAFGLALRAAGQGMRVLIVQFLKGQQGVGTVQALSKTALPITVSRFGRPGYLVSKVCEPLDRVLAAQGLVAFHRAMEDGNYDMIVLDEINVAVFFGLLTVEGVMELIRERPPAIHLVLTGRYAPKEFLDIADIVTEMKELKHHYSKGVPVQKGIEL
jgi:cob(I)alamin adenosyltransferase